ncbi:MAG: carbon-nitrogen hydrolase family protein [Flavobacteriales bacterium]|nr:carbon-nitrogen hydrolase family protein [Flavobacteriales bacterium]
MSRQEKKSRIKLAMGQLLVEGGEPERNLERAKKMIAQAKEYGAELIVLPETIDFAWTHPSAFDEALPIPGAYSNRLCSWAKQYGIYICAGLTEKRSDGRLFNTALLVDNNGEILIKYHKINLIEVEQPYYEIGDILRVVDSPWGKIGINICADNYRESVHIGKTLGAMGARIILSPSSWTVNHGISEIDDPYEDKWVKPLSYIATMYDCLVISTTSVGYIVGGPYEGKKMVGCSLAVTEKGIIGQGQFNEFAGEVIYVDADIHPQNAFGSVLNQKISSKGFAQEVDLWKK